MQSGRYKVVNSLKLFNEANQSIGKFEKDEVIHVNDIEKDRAEVTYPKSGWVKTDDLILKVTPLDVILPSRKMKKKKMKVGKTKGNAKRRKVEKKKSQQISKFYYKSSKIVELFDGRGVKIGELFPNSIMAVKDLKTIKKKEFVTITWPVHDVQVRTSSLEMMVENDRLGEFNHQEDMVKFLNGFFCDRFCDKKMINFTKSFFKDCGQDIVYDISYNKDSEISRLFRHPGVNDFRKFHITKKCAVFINLPWFYKASLKPCVQRLLQEANKRNVVVDILVVQNASVSNRLNLGTLATAQWIGRDTFINPLNDDKPEKIGTGKIFLGYFTNRASLIRFRAENLREFKKLKLK